MESDSAKLEVVKNAPWIGALGDSSAEKREAKQRDY